MNHAERQLREVEERLEAVEAPAAPDGLLKKLQAEIPEELGGSGGSVERRSTQRWRLLAASLAVVAVGGALGYRLLQEGPSLGPPVGDEAEAPRGGAREGAEEIGEAVRVAPADRRSEEDEATASSEPLPADAIAAGPIDDVAEVESQQTAAAPSTNGELGERQDVALRRENLQRRRALSDRLEALSSEPPPSGEQTVATETPMAQHKVVGGSVAQRPIEPIPPPRAIGLTAPPMVREAGPSTGGTAEPNDQPYGDMFFQGYGTNPFVDTEDDPQSTFGLDVDTGSYTLTRGYLRRGHLPPADAVRVEEFVNFPDYGDPAPQRRDFAVVAEGAPSPFAATARTYLLRFALKGREVATADRKTAVLTFVVDVSGSMNRENRLELVKRALRLLVEQLDPGDAIGLVIYGSRGHVLLEPSSDHARVLAAVDRLRPEGSTNAEEGLRLGYDVARRHYRRDAINRLILCSDGVANVGATGPESILDRVAGEAEGGIELTTVGFGMGNYNDVLMEQLADRGDGNYAYVDDLEAARRVFVENLTGTLQTIAGDAKVQVEFAPRQVQSYRLLGYENRDIADRDFRNDAVDAGEIGAGHQVTALYEVKLRDGAPRRGTLATLRLRYRSQASGQVVEDAIELDRGDLAGDWRRASRGLQLAAVAAEFAELLKGSYWVKDRSLADLAARAGELSRPAAGGGDAAELAELIGIAARLRGSVGSEIGAGSEPDD